MSRQLKQLVVKINTVFELACCDVQRMLQVFAASDLQEKGKSGYQAVFNTVIQLGLKINEKYDQRVSTKFCRSTLLFHIMILLSLLQF